MKKIIGALAIAASAALVLAGGAEAAITQFSVTSATLNSTNNAVVVKGTITCQSGRVARVQASVNQGDPTKIFDDAFGSAEDNRIVCTGASQTWRVSVLASNKPPFHSGPAQVCAAAQERRESDQVITDRVSQQCINVNL